VGRLRAHAGGALVPDREPPLRLGLRVRAGAVHERPADLPRARQAARGVVVDQRDDLPARQPLGLRALGGAARPRALGLRTLPAVLQADGDLRRRGGRMARGRRAARRGARPRFEPALRRLLRRGAAGGLRVDGRRQRRAAGGVCAVRPQHQPRSAVERGAGIPPSGVRPAQSRGALPHARHAGPVRGDEGDGRRARSRGKDRGRPRRRGDPLRGRDQLAAAAAAVGRRKRRRAPRSRRRGRPRPPRRR
jgi:hypothetical protein